ncbi:MAG: hypothetical protein ACFBSG_05665 [Leptolyngbyaceae cyanobacterium]
MRIQPRLRAIGLIIGAVLIVLMIGRLAPSHASMTLVSSQPVLAIAPSQPVLVTEILHSAPVPVLYMTQAGEQVLVRCHPGFAPRIALRAMGSEPQQRDAQQEGVLSCRDYPPPTEVSAPDTLPPLRP